VRNQTKLVLLKSSMKSAMSCLLLALTKRYLTEQRNDGCSKDNWVYAPVDNLFFAMFTRVDSR